MTLVAGRSGQCYVWLSYMTGGEAERASLHYQGVWRVAVEARKRDGWVEKEG